LSVPRAAYCVRERNTCIVDGLLMTTRDAIAAAAAATTTTTTTEASRLDASATRSMLD